jgi:hypothetical protein
MRNWPEDECEQGEEFGLECDVGVTVAIAVSGGRSSSCDLDPAMAIQVGQ